MTERRQATDEEARALASALRLRILGRDPASILHHIRTLVRTGFLEPQEERRGTRGAREIPYLATRKSWRLSTPVTDRAMLDTFLEEVGLVSAADLDMSRLGLRLPAADLAEFRQRLLDLLEEFASRPDDPAAAAWSLFVALHPDPNRP
jgi:hypothetical protein